MPSDDLAAIQDLQAGLEAAVFALAHLSLCKGVRPKTSDDRLREEFPAMSEKFWSDDFDMDLLKVFPATPQILGSLAEHAVWTVGHSTHGRLNHPCTWNSHGAFVWLEKPNLKRDEHGWFNVHGCVADEGEIECTWVELLRDQWPHSYAFILLMPYGDRIGFPPPPQREFMQIMYDLRGWFKTDVQASRNEALKWLTRMNEKFTFALEAYEGWKSSFDVRERGVANR